MELSRILRDGIGGRRWTRDRSTMICVMDVAKVVVTGAPGSSDLLSTVLSAGAGRAAGDDPRRPLNPTGVGPELGPPRP